MTITPTLDVNIFVLNLEKDKGRLQDVASQFASAGLKFNRVDGLFDPKLFSEASNMAKYDNKANVNCTRGHVKCLFAASKAGGDFALICEDDFKIITPSKFARQLDSAIAVANEKGLDILQVGWLPRGSSLKVVQRNYRISRALNIFENSFRWLPVKLGFLKEAVNFSSGGHTYLVRINKCGEISKYLESNFHIPIDWIYKQLANEPRSLGLPVVMRYRYNLAIQSNVHRSNVDHRS
jgi:GR25 family glycosyltransferase involved in LPS biosynthesis